MIDCRFLRPSWKLGCLVLSLALHPFVVGQPVAHAQNQTKKVPMSDLPRTPRPLPGEPDVTDCSVYVGYAVRQGQENKRRLCGYTGPRWTATWIEHENWCRSVGVGSRLNEYRARKQDLVACKPFAREKPQLPKGGVTLPSAETTPNMKGPVYSTETKGEGPVPARKCPPYKPGVWPNCKCPPKLAGQRCDQPSVN